MSDLDLDKTIQDGADFAFDYASAIFFSLFFKMAPRGTEPVGGLNLAVYIFWMFRRWSISTSPAMASISCISAL